MGYVVARAGGEGGRYLGQVEGGEDGAAGRGPEHGAGAVADVLRQLRALALVLPAVR